VTAIAGVAVFPAVAFGVSFFAEPAITAPYDDGLAIRPGLTGTGAALLLDVSGVQVICPTARGSCDVKERPPRFEVRSNAAGVWLVRLQV
jgi:hypothetical protein